MAMSTCTVCGEVFKSTFGFDKHRVGEFGGYRTSTRRCMTRDEMKAAGMVKNGHGRWIATVYDVSAWHGKGQK